MNSDLFYGFYKTDLIYSDIDNYGIVNVFRDILLIEPKIGYHLLTKRNTGRRDRIFVITNIDDDGEYELLSGLPERYLFYSRYDYNIYYIDVTSANKIDYHSYFSPLNKPPFMIYEGEEMNVILSEGIISRYRPDDNLYGDLYLWDYNAPEINYSKYVYIFMGLKSIYSDDDIFMYNIGKPDVQYINISNYSDDIIYFEGIKTCQDISFYDYDDVEYILQDSNELGGYNDIYMYYYPSTKVLLKNVPEYIYFTDITVEPNVKYLIYNSGKPDNISYKIIDTLLINFSGIISDNYSYIPTNKPNQGEEYQLIINNSSIENIHKLFFYDNDKNKWCILKTGNIYFTDVDVNINYFVNYIDYDTFYLHKIVNSNSISFNGIVSQNISINAPLIGQEYILINNDNEGGYNTVYHYDGSNWNMLNITSENIYFTDLLTNNKYLINKPGKYNNMIYDIISSPYLYISGVIVNSVPSSAPSQGQEYKFVDNNNILGGGNIYYYNNNKWYILDTEYTNLYFIDIVNNIKYYIKNVGFINYEITQYVHTSTIYSGYYAVLSTISINNLTNNELIKLIKGSEPENNDYLLIKDETFKLFKYDNEFIEITTPLRYIFYSVNGDVINNSTSAMLLISNNTSSNIGELDINNNVFYGTTDSNNTSNLYFDDETCEICKYNNYLWTLIYHTLTKFTFISDTDRYLVNNNIVTKINFMINKYQGYQGYSSDLNVENCNDSAIISRISQLKLGRPVINGDSLLVKNNFDNKYNIFVVDSNTTVVTFVLKDEFVIFNDLLTLQLLKVNKDNKLIIGNFDQNDYSCDSLTLQNNVLYYDNYKYYNCLYKFNYNNLLSYVNYYDLKIYSITNNDNYLGYYDSLKTLNYRYNVGVLEILQNIKQDYVDINNVLLVKIGETYTSCMVKINNNQLEIIYENLNNVSFLNINGDKLNSQNVVNNTITQLSFEHDLNNNLFEGFIGYYNYYPQGINNDFLINTKTNKIYQCYNNNWSVCKINKTNIQYKSNNIIYNIELDLNNIIINIETTSILKGYYYESNEINYNDILFYAKNCEGEDGDLLLVKNDNNIILTKYNNNEFTVIDVESNYYLFYSNNGGLLLITNTENLKSVESWEQEFEYGGLASNIYPHSSLSNINNKNKTYLNSSSGKVYLCYEYEQDKYQWIPIINPWKSKDKYIGNEKIYIIYNGSDVVEIEFNENNYQGFYGNNISELKAGKPEINGDTLLKKDGIDNNLVLTKELDENYVLFYNVSDLQILKVNKDECMIYLDYFDINNRDFSNNVLQNNNLYTLVNEELLLTFNSLYKFKYNDYLVYVKYSDLKILLVDIDNTNTFQGYYSDDVLDSSLINILTKISLIKNDVINNGDSLLNNNKIYLINVVDDVVNIIEKIITSEIIFFYIDNDNIKSIKGEININFTHLLTNNFIGTIGSYPDNNIPVLNFVEGDLLLNRSDSTLYQFDGEEWIQVYINNRYILFTNNDKIYSIETNFITDEIIITDLTNI